MANGFRRDHGWRIFKRNSSRAECRTREVPEPALLILENLLAREREREREREKASVIPSFPPFPSSSFREGSPRNLNIRHPSARSQPLPANCTFGIFRSPCIARSFSSRFEYADEIFHRGIIIAVLTCQIIFPARAESVKILKNLSYRERERESEREREREREKIFYYLISH